MELFNDVMDSHYNDSSEISDAGKLQIARAIGVSIVKNGSMYPTLELLLRHAIQYLGLRGTMAVANPGVLDSEADFIAEISTEVSIYCVPHRIHAACCCYQPVVLPSFISHTRQLDLYDGYQLDYVYVLNGVALFVPCSATLLACTQAPDPDNPKHKKRRGHHSGIGRNHHPPVLSVAEANAKGVRYALSVCTRPS